MSTLYYRALGCIKILRNWMVSQQGAYDGGATTFLDRIAGLPQSLLIGSALAIFISLSMIAICQESVTNDEVAHIPAGYTYLVTGDYRLNPEHPPLVKILASLPLIFLDLKLPEDSEDWQIGQEWAFGYRFLYQSGNDPDKILFWARLPMVFWGALLIVSIYAVARQIFGVKGAFISLALTAFCPEILAHSHLVNTDAAAASMMFLAIASYWRFADRPNLTRGLSAGLMLGGALSTKYSAVILIPALLWVQFLAWIRRRRESQNKRGDALRPPSCLRHSMMWMGHVCLLALASLTVIWGLYRFRHDCSPDGEFTFRWDFQNTRDSVIGKSVRFARDYRILPEAFCYGFSYMHANSMGRNAFVLGQYSYTGWWWYFPFAFLVKTPFGTLVLMGWGLYASLRRNASGQSPDYYIVAPLIIYWVMAMANNMNIGHRHVLPVYPLMIVLAGGILGAQKVSRRILQEGILIALTLLSAIECLWGAPYYIAHFNPVSLALFKRHEMLVDSSIDWGQDLGRLKKWMDRNGISEIKLSYRGNASPRQIGLQHQQLRGSNMYTDYEYEWKWARKIIPGDIVALSVTNLVGVLFDDKHYYLRKYRNLEPFAEIGHSIMVFKIPADWDSDQ